MIRKLIAIALLAVPGVAHADWHEATSAHFVVYSNDKPENVKQEATDLERFDKLLRITHGVDDPPVGPANRVIVYVLDSLDDVSRLSSSTPNLVAGFYEPRAGESVAFVPRTAGDGDRMNLGPQAILFHEYTHHFMLSTWPNSPYPGWFTEGFAEFYATATMDKDGGVTIGAPPLYRLDGILNASRARITVERMLKGDSYGDGEADSFYGRGWLLVDLLTFEPSRKGQFAAYMLALNQGKSPLEAASVFGDVKSLERDLYRYEAKSLMTLHFPASAVPTGTVEVRRLRSGEAAIMPVRIRSTRGVDQNTAPGVYADAKRVAASYPDDPYVQVTLAETAHDANDFAGCEAATDRAITADPKLARAFLYQARCRMAAARAAKDKKPETWDAIRKLIGTANRLDTENPEPLELYYQSFAESGTSPPDAARHGLEYAFELAPDDQSLRLNLALMYLQQRQAAQARELLIPLAFYPHVDAKAPLARRMIDAIDAGDIAKALELPDIVAKETKGGKDGKDKGKHAAKSDA